MAVVRALRNLGLVAAAGAIGGAVYVSDITNSPWWSSLAPVRFSRATFAVSWHQHNSALYVVYLRKHPTTDPAPFSGSCSGVDGECRLQVEPPEP